MFYARSWTAWEIVETTAPARTPLAMLSSILSTSAMAPERRENMWCHSAATLAPGLSRSTGAPHGASAPLPLLVHYLGQQRHCGTDRSLTCYHTHPLSFLLCVIRLLLFLHCHVQPEVQGGLRESMKRFRFNPAGTAKKRSRTKGCCCSHELLPPFTFYGR